MKRIVGLLPLTLVTSAMVLCASSASWAEGTTIQIQPKDTLGSIVSKYYPNHPKRDALMQYLLQTNPNAFRENSFHKLIVGKDLKLPTLDSLPPELQKAPEKSAKTASTATPTTTEPSKTQTPPSAEATQPTKQSEKPAETTTTASATTTGDDIEFLKQQFDEISATNEQIQAENKKLKEELAAAKQTAPATSSTAPAAGEDVEFLKQQFDEISATNEQIQAENKKLKEELVAAKQTASAASSGSAATSASGDDVEFLKQQFDDISAANEQIQAENKQLKAALAAAQQGQTQTAATPATENTGANDAAFLQQRLDEIEAANEAVNAENKTLKQQVAAGAELQTKLDAANKDLLLVRAALANNELTRSKASNGAPWWLWGLSLPLIPLAWWLGRKNFSQAINAPTVTATAPKPSTVTSPTPSSASAATPPAPLNLAEDSAVKHEYTPAANDDNPEAAIKLDIVRAYLDLRDATAAQPLLREVLQEGGLKQQQEAREILSFLS